MTTPTPTASPSTASPTAAFDWSTRRIILTAVLIVLVQLTAACLLSQRANPLAAYRACMQWDAKLVAEIVDNGYHRTGKIHPATATDVGNVAFLPGYPLVARLLARGLGLPTDLAMLLVAQGCAVLFWTQTMLILRKWRVAAGVARFGLVVLAAHPAAFFLAMPYSESLFLLALLAYLHHANGDSLAARTIAYLAGFLLTSTRIVGLPMAFAPLVGAAMQSPRPRLAGWSRLVLTALVASMGGAIFLLFCQLRFGRWDVYFLAQAVGWSIQPDYLAPFDPRNYFRFTQTLRTHGVWETNDLSRLAVLIVAVAIGMLAWREWRTQQQATTSQLPVRVPYYFAGLVAFYLAFAGTASVMLQSMLRYTLVTHVCFTLAAIHWYTSTAPDRAATYQPGRAAVFGVMFAIALQLILLWQFVNGMWVA